jgi:hypothetical protein
MYGTLYDTGTSPKLAARHHHHGTTVSSKFDLRKIPRFLPFYYSYSRPLQEVRCFRVFSENLKRCQAKIVCLVLGSSDPNKQMEVGDA